MNICIITVASRNIVLVLYTSYVENTHMPVELVYLGIQRDALFLLVRSTNRTSRKIPLDQKMGTVK